MSSARFRLLLSAIFLTGTFLGAGCGGRPAVTSKALPSPIISRHEEALDPSLLDAGGERDGEAYRVGAGDTILVAVYRHPELSIGQYAGATVGASGQGSRLAGLVVDNDGTAQFPLIGSLQVAGKTSDELRLYLEQELARYVNEPKVTVQVVFTGSIRYYLLGQFTQPGLKFSDRPLRLLEALSLGGTVVLERASLTTAYVARRGKRLAINMRRLILDGDMRQNIRLQTGDIVCVPDNSAEQVFVFRGVLDGTPGAQSGVVPLRQGRLDLLQALAQAGFSFRERSRGRLSETRVIRSEGDRGQLFTVDVERMLKGEAGGFPLMPGDVVFVPSTSFASWNEAIAQILPNLQAVSGLLTPFVQIKFLSE